MRILGIAMALALLTSNCAAEVDQAAPPPAPDDKTAVALVVPTEGHNVHGTVWFTDVADGVRVQAEITGLQPNQLHGFHLHTYGDATCPADGMCLGGHYDPAGTDYHALPGTTDRAHHAGDLGNLEADAEGKAVYDATFSNISVMGEHHPIVGRSVVVHANPDDGSQPVGNAGPRIGFGVIGIAEPR